MIQVVEGDGVLLAIILRKGFNEPGIHFFTPDELSQQERLLRVRGCGEKAIEQLAQGAYHTVEDVVNEQDLMRLADSSGLEGSRIHSGDNL